MQIAEFLDKYNSVFAPNETGNIRPEDLQDFALDISATFGTGNFKGSWVAGQMAADEYWISGNKIWKTKQSFNSATAPTAANAYWELVLDCGPGPIGFMLLKPGQPTTYVPDLGAATDAASSGNVIALTGPVTLDAEITIPEGVGFSPNGYRVLQSALLNLSTETVLEGNNSSFFQTSTGGITIPDQADAQGYASVIRDLNIVSNRSNGAVLTTVASAGGEGLEYEFSNLNIRSNSTTGTVTAVNVVAPSGLNSPAVLVMNNGRLEAGGTGKGLMLSGLTATIRNQVIIAKDNGLVFDLAEGNYTLQNCVFVFLGNSTAKIGSNATVNFQNCQSLTAQSTWTSAYIDMTGATGSTVTFENSTLLKGPASNKLLYANAPGNTVNLKGSTVTGVTGDFVGVTVVDTRPAIQPLRQTKTITANYTVTAADHNYTILVNAAAPIVITLPAGLAGMDIIVKQVGAGTFEFAAGSGATVENLDSKFKSAGVKAVATVFSDSNNVWTPNGQLVA